MAGSHPHSTPHLPPSKKASQAETPPCARCRTSQKRSARSYDTSDSCLEISCSSLFALLPKIDYTVMRFHLVGGSPLQAMHSLEDEKDAI
eukprot:1093-Amphidinium_carterae.1